MASLQLPPPDPVFLTTVPTTHTKLKRARDKLGSVTAGPVHIPFLLSLVPQICFVDSMPFKVQAFSCLFVIFKSLDSNSGDKSLQSGNRSADWVFTPIYVDSVLNYAWDFFLTWRIKQANAGAGMLCKQCSLLGCCFPQLLKSVSPTVAVIDGELRSKWPSD